MEISSSTFYRWRLLSYSFINPQVTYAIFISSQSFNIIYNPKANWKQTQRNCDTREGPMIRPRLSIYRYYLTRFFQFLRILNCFLFFFLLSVHWFKFAFSKRLTTLASFPGLQGYTLKPWRKSFYTMSPNLWLFSLSSSSPSVVQ